MASYENIRRRWISAFSSNALFGGLGFVPETSRRRSGTGLEWGSGNLFLGAGSPTGVDRRPSLGLVDGTTHHRVVIGETLFRNVLTREKNRAERFDTPLVLLLLELDDRAAVSTRTVWNQAIEAVNSVVRETDVVGWASRGRILAVLLTEMAESEEPVAREMERRIRTELVGRLDPGTVATVSLRLQFCVGSRNLRCVDLFKDVQPHSRRPSWQDGLKRTLDIVGSLILLLLLSPVFLLLAALIKLRSPGPVFFRQVRIGQNARPFTMLKFRSMHVNADLAVHQQYVTQFIKSSLASTGVEHKVFKLTKDSRVTSIGRLLRKTSLDELPQLWNVLRGEMSLVGPRPPLQYEMDQYKPWHRRRVLDAKPGMTGLWQVTGRSRTTFDEMVRLDLRYARTRSFWTDIRILLATPRAVIEGKGAC
jgi:lipopolysaccharide/colanic/teichoic acid biosynthesis glycosyltransferase